MSEITREQALALLQKYNKEPFHILHGLTVEGVMRYFAQELGYGDQMDFWGLCGLLHDVDFELYPEEHCRKPRNCWLRLVHRRKWCMLFAPMRMA